MKRSGIDAATVAGYIYDLESENAWMRDRCKDMIDISDLKGVAVGISEELVRRKIGENRTVKYYVKQGLLKQHPKTTDSKMFLDLFEVLMSPEKSVLRRLARDVATGAKLEELTEKITRAMVKIDDKTGSVTIVTEGGQLTIRSLRVTVTNKLPQGEFLVGEYGTWKVREGEAIIRSGLNEDDFQHNRMSFIGEIFFTSYIPTNHTGSWVKVNFATIKEALKKTAEAA